MVKHFTATVVAERLEAVYAEVAPARAGKGTHVN
jgi:hypothetical protein